MSCALTARDVTKASSKNGFKKGKHSLNTEFKAFLFLSHLVEVLCVVDFFPECRSVAEMMESSPQEGKHICSVLAGLRH